MFKNITIGNIICIFFSFIILFMLFISIDSNIPPASDTESIKPKDTQYVPSPNNPGKLSTKKEFEIKEDYLTYIKTIDDPYYKALYNPEYGDINNLTVNDVQIISYYGTYSDAELIKITTSVYRGVLQGIVEKEIAGYTVKFPDGGIYMLHVGNTFMYIEDAYASGKITKQDVEDIHYYFS